MKPLILLTSISCLLVLPSCVGGGKKAPPQHTAAEGLSDRLNRNYGYAVDQQGNWVPRTDKRSQYEGRGGSAYFNGNLQKKAFQTENLKKGSWMGNKQLNLADHRLSGAESGITGQSRHSSQQASLDRTLQTPARIHGNHLPTELARETGANGIGKPSDAETDFRRRVFRQPDIIDYRQQRELSIQQSKQLLGRDD